MATTLHWEGREVELRIFFTPRLAMVATDATVAVDGKRVARKGGVALAETATGSFSHQGREVRTELTVGGKLGVFTRIPYTLKFDGAEVSAGTLRLEGVAPAVLSWLMVLGLLALLAVTV
jgi:hypothetical protein